MSAHLDTVKFAQYRCPACGCEVLRQSGKKWIKSYCEKTGKYARLQRVKREKK